MVGVAGRFSSKKRPRGVRTHRLAVLSVDPHAKRGSRRKGNTNSRDHSNGLSHAKPPSRKGKKKRQEEESWKKQASTGLVRV